jgi:exopolyphosphatase/guanosine-5'-triphosphate,3'-diphosphate pyrophosphatase
LPNRHIAAVDLGTNSFHLIIADVKGNGSFEIVDRRREIIRIGSHKMGYLPFITDDEISRSIEILIAYKRLADEYKAEIKAVATSAIRESSNGKEFVEKIFNETLIRVEIISGKREAELIFSGAAKAVNLRDKNILVIDTGGGSTEIIFGNNDKIIFAESLKLGSVRLSRKFFPDYILSPEKIEHCRNFIKNELMKRSYMVSKFSYDTFIGASGTILSAAATIYFIKHKYFPEKLNGREFRVEDLTEFTGRVLSGLTKEERLSIPGIEEKRADILPAGLLILNELFAFFNINTLTLSEYGLREGMIISSLMF